MNEYLSIGKEGTSEYEEKKSRFFGFAKPVTTEEEALDFLKKIKSTFPDARHHVYGYVLRSQNTVRYSDDREPQGTAGMPVLDTIRKKNLCDCIIVVVRYFGGTLLGTGGLVRAYGAAASKAIDDAGIVAFSKYTYTNITVGYTEYQKLLPFLSANKIEVISQDFTDTVNLCICSKEIDTASFISEMTELCYGRITFCEEKTIFECKKL